MDSRDILLRPEESHGLSDLGKNIEKRIWEMGLKALYYNLKTENTQLINAYATRSLFGNSGDP
ncbi:MAG: hypothetical protein ACYDBK_04775 [Thermoplasmataceae archaeon]